MMCIFCYCACKRPFPPSFFSIPRKWKEEFIDFTSSSILLLPSSGKMGGASLIIQNIFNGGNISVMLTYWLFIMYGWTFSPYVDGSTWNVGCKNRCALDLLVLISDIQNIKQLQLIWWMCFSVPTSYGVQTEKFRRYVTENGPRYTSFFSLIFLLVDYQRKLWWVSIDMLKLNFFCVYKLSQNLRSFLRLVPTSYGVRAEKFRRYVTENGPRYTFFFSLIFLLVEYQRKLWWVSIDMLKLNFFCVYKLSQNLHSFLRLPDLISHSNCSSFTGNVTMQIAHTLSTWQSFTQSAVTISTVVRTLNMILLRFLLSKLLYTRTSVKIA